MFQIILFAGFLYFSLGELNPTVSPTTLETTEVLASAKENWIMTSSTQQPVITGLRITVQSLVDLTRNSAEMELLVRQISENLIPSSYRDATSITVRSIQRYPPVA